MLLGLLPPGMYYINAQQQTGNVNVAVKDSIAIPTFKGVISKTIYLK
jgi:hypothetical protein